MSTRSRIGYVTKNGIYNTAYCHHDGYPKHLGWILFHCFTSLEQIEKLVSNGGFSSVSCYSETEAAPSGVYDDEEVKSYTSLKEMLEDFDSSDEEYLYVFDNNRWIYYEHEPFERNTTSDYFELSENRDVQEPFKYYFVKRG